MTPLIAMTLTAGSLLFTGQVAAQDIQQQDKLKSELVEDKKGVGTILSWNIGTEKPNEYQLRQIVEMRDRIASEVEQNKLLNTTKLLQLINASIDSNFEGGQNTVYLKDAFAEAEGKKAKGTFDCDSRAIMLMAVLERLGYSSNLVSMCTLEGHMVLWIKNENKFLELTTNEMRELSAAERLQLNEINNAQKYLSHLLSNEATDLALNSGRLKEKSEEAIRKFDESTKLDPGNITAYLNHIYMLEKELTNIDQQEIDAIWQIERNGEKPRVLQEIKAERQRVINQAKEVYRGLFTTLARRYKELTPSILINNKSEIAKLQGSQDPYAVYLSGKFANYAEFLYFKAEDYPAAIEAWQSTLDKAGSNLDEFEANGVRIYMAKAMFKAGQYKQFIKESPGFISGIAKFAPFQSDIDELRAMLLAAKIISGEIRINESNVKDFCNQYSNDPFLRPFINGEDKWNMRYMTPVETIKSWDGFKQMMELINKAQGESIEKPINPSSGSSPIVVREVATSSAYKKGGDVGLFMKIHDDNGTFVPTGTWNFVDLSMTFPVLKTNGAANCIVFLLIDNKSTQGIMGHYPYVVSKHSDKDLNTDFYKFIKGVETITNANTKYTLYLFGGSAMRYGGNSVEAAVEEARQNKVATTEALNNALGERIGAIVDKTIDGFGVLDWLIADIGNKEITYHYARSPEAGASSPLEGVIALARATFANGSKLESNELFEDYLSQRNKLLNLFSRVAGIAKKAAKKNFGVVLYPASGVDISAAVSYADRVLTIDNQDPFTVFNTFNLFFNEVEALKEQVNSYLEKKLTLGFHSSGIRQGFIEYIAELVLLGADLNTLKIVEDRSIGNNRVTTVEFSIMNDNGTKRNIRHTHIKYVFDGQSLPENIYSELKNVVGDRADVLLLSKAGADLDGSKKWVTPISNLLSPGTTIVSDSVLNIKSAKKLDVPSEDIGNLNLSRMNNYGYADKSENLGFYEIPVAVTAPDKTVSSPINSTESFLIDLEIEALSSLVKKEIIRSSSVKSVNLLGIYMSGVTTILAKYQDAGLGFDNTLNRLSLIMGEQGVSEAQIKDLNQGVRKWQGMVEKLVVAQKQRWGNVEIAEAQLKQSVKELTAGGKKIVIHGTSIDNIFGMLASGQMIQGPGNLGKGNYFDIAKNEDTYAISRDRTEVLLLLDKDRFVKDYGLVPEKDFIITNHVVGGVVTDYEFFIIRMNLPMYGDYLKYFKLITSEGVSDLSQGVPEEVDSASSPIVNENTGMNLPPANEIHKSISLVSYPSNEEGYYSPQASENLRRFLETLNIPRGSVVLNIGYGRNPLSAAGFRVINVDDLGGLSNSDNYEVFNGNFLEDDFLDVLKAEFKFEGYPAVILFHNMKTYLQIYSPMYNINEKRYLTRARELLVNGGQILFVEFMPPNPVADPFRHSQEAINEVKKMMGGEYRVQKTIIFEEANNSNLLVAAAFEMAARRASSPISLESRFNGQNGWVSKPEYFNWLRKTRDLIRGKTGSATPVRVYYYGMGGGRSPVTGGVEQIDIISPLIATDFDQLYSYDYSEVVSLPVFKVGLNRQLSDLGIKDSDVRIEKIDNSFQFSFTYEGKQRTVMVTYGKDAKNEFPSELLNGFEVLYSRGIPVVFRDMQVSTKSALLDQLRKQGGFLVMESIVTVPVNIEGFRRVDMGDTSWAGEARRLDVFQAIETPVSSMGSTSSPVVDTQMIKALKSLEGLEIKKDGEIYKFEVQVINNERWDRVVVLKNNRGEEIGFFELSTKSFGFQNVSYIKIPNEAYRSRGFARLILDEVRKTFPDGKTITTEIASDESLAELAKGRPLSSIGIVSLFDSAGWELIEGGYYDSNGEYYNEPFGNIINEDRDRFTEEIAGRVVVTFKAKGIQPYLPGFSPSETDERSSSPITTNIEKAEKERVVQRADENSASSLAEQIRTVFEEVKKETGEPIVLSPRYLSTYLFALQHNLLSPEALKSEMLSSVKWGQAILANRVEVTLNQTETIKKTQEFLAGELARLKVPYQPTPVQFVRQSLPGADAMFMSPYGVFVVRQDVDDGYLRAAIIHEEMHSHAVVEWGARLNEGFTEYFRNRVLMVDSEISYATVMDHHQRKFTVKYMIDLVAAMLLILNFGEKPFLRALFAGDTAELERAIGKDTWGAILDLSARYERELNPADFNRQLQTLLGERLQRNFKSFDDFKNREKLLPIVDAAESEAPGGIDFRAMPVTTQPVMNTQLNNMSMPRQLVNVNLDESWNQIQNMLKAEIIPSSERIKEYLQACCEKKDMDQEIDKVLACIADILRLQEDRAVSTDSSLKEMLGLLESNKGVNEMQIVLAKIIVLQEEPLTITQ